MAGANEIDRLWPGRLARNGQPRRARADRLHRRRRTARWGRGGAQRRHRGRGVRRGAPGGDTVVRTMRLRVRRRLRWRVRRQRRPAPGRQIGGDRRHVSRRLPASELLVPDVNVGLLRQRRDLVDELLARERPGALAVERHVPLQPVVRRPDSGAAGPVGRRGTGGGGGWWASTPRVGNADRTVRFESSNSASCETGCTATAPECTTGPAVGIPPPEGRRASRTVIRFAQVLHLTLRTFPRTRSSAMEYLVWQRSQTNFMRTFRALHAGARARDRRGKVSLQGHDYHRGHADYDEGRDDQPAHRALRGRRFRPDGNRGWRDRDRRSRRRRGGRGWDAGSERPRPRLHPHR